MSQPYKPHGYQKRMIKFGVSRPVAGFLADPGLGKTSVIYAIFKVLQEQGIINRMLVISPLRAAWSVWPVEAAHWEDFNHLRVQVQHGPEKGVDLDVDVDVINPEGLPWLVEQVKKFRDWPWEMLVVDESTRFKHANTKRFKLLRPLLPRFQRRYILTGSPAPNGLLDLFGQIYILDLGHSLGQYITHYRMHYFDNPDRMGWNWVPREGAEEAIHKKLQPLVQRVAGADYLELPPLIENKVEVVLDSKTMATYHQMEEMLIAALKDDVITAANAGVASSKCRQIANGGIYHEGGEKWSNIHDTKTEAVKEIVEELQGKPALVAYEFKHDLERLQAAFPGAPFIGGGVSSSRFREVEAAWNRGDLPVLLAQPQSVAHGLNLQGTAATIIWHSLTWNLEDYEQFIRRVWRQGQKERVIVHHIIAKGTIDEVIMETLGRKDHTQRALLAALKSRYRS